MSRTASLAIWTAVVLAIAATGTSASAGQDPGRCALSATALHDLPARVRARFEDAARALRARPSDPRHAGRLAMLFHAHEQFGSAEACYRTARQGDPEAQSWIYLLGVVQAESGQSAAAVRSFRAAVALDSGYLPARLRLADALFTAGSLDASASEYAAILGEVPELAIAHYGLGRVSAARGQTDGADSHYRKAVDISPQFGAAHYALALAYRDRAPLRAAEHLEAYRRWGTRRPMPPDPVLDEVLALKSTARVLISQGTIVAGNGGLEESVELHLKAIAEDPGAAQAHVNLISLYGRLGQTERAEQHYRAAVQLGTSLADAHYNYGVLLVSAGRPREAARAFQLTLETNPFHPQAHYNLATLLARENRWSDALPHYEQALANDPAHRAARFNLARSLLLLGRPRVAIEHLERLLPDAGKESAHVRSALAQAWHASGEVEKVRAAYEEALAAARAGGDVELAQRIERTLQSMVVARR